MMPNPRFLKLPLGFWAHIRSISQEFGYTDRATRQICVPTIHQIARSLRNLNLGTTGVIDASGTVTTFGQLVVDYFNYRADVLNNKVRLLLMDAAGAQALYKQVLANSTTPQNPVMNKQSGAKRQTAYLTSIVNQLIFDNLNGKPCNYDPRTLTTFTKNNAPLRTMARRVDGAYPSTVNPKAIWEIKEYYYTTTFGSRVADGVYETLLDGMELEELFTTEQVDCKHYLIVDAYYTWWDCGRSYLCRMVDMMHMGYVDEVMFGKEVETRLPIIVNTW